MKRSRYLLGASLMSVAILAACGGEGNDGNNNADPADNNANNAEVNDADNDGADDADADNDGNNDEEAADGDAPQGGTVTYGYTAPFAGVLDWNFYGGVDDSLALNIFNGDALYSISSFTDFEPEPSLAHDWEWSDDNLTVTFHLEEGVMWHNGEELTAEDFEFSYETIAHPDYDGPRLSNVDRIEGFDEYRAGDADSLEGVNVIDDYTFEVTFQEALANNLENLWAYPTPKAHLEHLEVSEIEDSEEVRQNPVGLGAFQVENIVPGEQIEYTAFEDYWQGAPNLDGAVYRIVDGNQAGELVAQGEVDIIELTPTQALPLEDNEDVTVEEIEALSYSYLGFKLGEWNAEDEVVEMNNPKFESKELRQAFAHAIDRQGIIDEFNEGYGTVINAPESHIRWSYPDESTLNQYEYDPDRARELLEEAGYEDVTGDGFVEDPDGEEFTVNLAAMDTPADIAEPRAQYILQTLQDVGINAQLMDGQLLDFNLFYDLVEEDDENIDIFMGAWGLATADPDPSGLWRSNDFWNFPRWDNEESDELIAEGLSEEALDIDYRQEVYQEWHQLVNEELPLIPLNSPTDLYGINANVGGVTVDVRDATANPHEWYIDEE
ncbi:oligopeptide ABC transporter substrate-binding protein [Alkalicoccus luteus]|uniref:Oligopeptide ABC transporter substrate-binding protein n=1 Tax=Alkalicoccus luteus TaxID=1237094 RepID=A0A969Q1D4_9BACI|nr:oligopeptide ABC transporter substrate-binding protein [Alkalicoccus luteus]NJP39302.1 oligopeptide ABC transporter substrate-binding protein [Alkalicoccus luteus]